MQLGFVQAQEVGIREGEDKGHFVLAIVGPNLGNRTYRWLSRASAEKLVADLTQALEG